MKYTGRCRNVFNVQGEASRPSAARSAASSSAWRGVGVAVIQMLFGIFCTENH
jgi:hypothetical protein